MSKTADELWAEYVKAQAHEQLAYEAWIAQKTKESLTFWWGYAGWWRYKPSTGQELQS